MICFGPFQVKGEPRSEYYFKCKIKVYIRRWSNSSGVIGLTIAAVSAYNASTVKPVFCGHNIWPDHLIWDVPGESHKECPGGVSWPRMLSTQTFQCVKYFLKWEEMSEYKLSTTSRFQYSFWSPVCIFCTASFKYRCYRLDGWPPMHTLFNLSQ